MPQLLNLFFLFHLIVLILGQNSVKFLKVTKIAKEIMFEGVQLESKKSFQTQ